MKKIKEWIPFIAMVVMFVVIPVILIIASGRRWRISGPQPGDIMYEGLTSEDIEYLKVYGELPPDSNAVPVIITPSP